VACKQRNLLPADVYEFSGDSYDYTRQLSGATWRHVAIIENPKEKLLVRFSGSMAASYSQMGS
jgi:formate dehydrogenase iron-sulfur subunit